MKTIIITEEILNSLSQSAREELAILNKKNISLKKQCKDLIASFSNNSLDHRTDIGKRELSYDKGITFLKIDRWHKTAGEQWGNCAGVIIRVESIGIKYVKLECEHYRTNERGWNEYQTIDIETFLSFLMDWKVAEDCSEAADQDILLKKLSARISNIFN